MRVFRHLAFVALALCVTGAWGQGSKVAPQIGFLYPAGGQQGTVAHITVGGQYLRGADGIFVTGEGVSAKVIQHYRPIRNIKKEQAHEVQKRLIAQWEKRFAELKPDERKAMVFLEKFWSDRKRKIEREAKDIEFPENFKPLEHPLLYHLEDQSLWEVQHAFSQIFFPRQKKQINTQIGENVLLEVTIDADAAPGDREFRLRTPLGLSNPMCFQVGRLPETAELEPNDPQKYPLIPEADPVDLPVLFNGQIMPGDVDRLRFRAKRGQALMMKTQARHLIPYLADSVPGWFQATLR